ncbi:MAG: signal peptidase I [Candidatus Hadarchaeales archaeon]
MVTAILIIAILYFGLRGTLMLLLNTETPMMAVVSNSMKPTFERGDLLIVEGVSSPTDVKRGDIIVYYSELQEALIVHRVIEVLVDENGHIKFRTQGDANLGPDPKLVNPEDVRGKVRFVIPKVGYLSLLIRGD